MTADTMLPMAGAISAQRKKVSHKQRGLLEDFQAMRKAMVEQKGLINHAQAGLILEVSTKRIGELVDLGKLERFDFLGRTYVSAKQIHERREMDLKAGRPACNNGQKLKATAKLLANVDAAQFAAMVTTEPPSKKKRRNNTSQT